MVEAAKFPKMNYNAWMREQMAKESPNGPLIVGITCIYVPVRDVQKSAKWYEQMLGCEPIAPVEPGAGGSIMRFAEWDRTKAPALFLVRDDNAAGTLRYTYDEGNSAAPACLITPRIQEIYDRFKENGVTVEDAPDDGRACGPNIKFYDPDGNKWEVWQP